MNMLVRKYGQRCPKTDTMSLDIKDFEILSSFISVNTEVEILISDNFLINVIFHGFLIFNFQFFFEIQIV